MKPGVQDGYKGRASVREERMVPDEAYNRAPGLAPPSPLLVRDGASAARCWGTG